AGSGHRPVDRHHERIRRRAGDQEGQLEHPTVRTSTRMAAARMPGTRSGPRTRRKTSFIRAPHIRAALSIVGLICSMNGVIVMMTNGTEGTRFTRTTAARVRPNPTLYITVASGMP